MSCGVRVVDFSVCPSGATALPQEEHSPVMVSIFFLEVIPVPNSARFPDWRVKLSSKMRGECPLGRAMTVSTRAETHKGGDDGLGLLWLLVSIEPFWQWGVSANYRDGKANGK